jgi:hypothetical protein
MQHEQALLLALAICLAQSARVVTFLRRPLHGLLAETRGSDTQAGFWTSYATVVIFVVPLIAVMIGRADVTDSDPLFFQVVDLAKWGLVGLIGAMLMVACGVAVLTQPRRGRVFVDQHQMNDLERLLTKVDEIRAHNILRRSPERERSEV